MAWNNPGFKPIELKRFGKYDHNTHEIEGIKLVEFDRFGLTWGKYPGCPSISKNMIIRDDF